MSVKLASIATNELLAELQRRVTCAEQQERHTIFVGPPGAGKGTQCKKITDEYGFVHLSAGDLLRAERKRDNSEVGAMIDNFIKEGKIVPVEVTVGLIKSAMQEGLTNGSNKYLIDGFPRNKDNLEGWHKIMGEFADVRFTLFLDCPEKTMETRLLGRNEGRTDDNIESIRKRFHTYQVETRPILDIFEKEVGARIPLISFVNETKFNFSLTLLKRESSEKSIQTGPLMRSLAKWSASFLNSRKPLSRCRRTWTQRKCLLQQ